ncbi:hypothetical protein JOM56_001931 [Amanita muscaria]
MPLIHPSFRFLLLAAAAFSFLCLLSHSNRRIWRISDDVDALIDNVASDLVRSLQINHSTNSEALEVLGIKQVQESLACYIQQGFWSGETFHLNTECLAGERKLSLAPVLSLCSMLRTKRILLVGPEATFYLHTLWLQSLSDRFNTSSKCTGIDFCTFHHICINGAIESSLRTPRNKKPPTLRNLSTYGSSILRFVLSTTLYASSDSHDRFYTTPVVEPQTQVRMKNAIWMNHARNSDLIVMNRGPLPAPAWTYSFSNNDMTGNWTFIDDLYASPSTRYLAAGNESSMAIRIINAAIHATLTVFLPGIMGTLATIQRSPIVRTKTLVWHGSWYLNPACTSHRSPEGFSVEPQLLSLYDDDDSLTRLDPWTLYYNAQGMAVLFSVPLLPNILPHFGIVYLPLAIPLAPPNITYKGRKKEGKNMFGQEERKDCLKYPLGVPEGRALEVAFLGGLVRFLEQA